MMGGGVGATPAYGALGATPAYGAMGATPAGGFGMETPMPGMLGAQQAVQMTPEVYQQVGGVGGWLVWVGGWTVWVGGLWVGGWVPPPCTAPKRTTHIHTLTPHTKHLPSVQLKLEQEMDSRNRPFSDEDLDAMLPGPSGSLPLLCLPALPARLRARLAVLLHTRWHTRCVDIATSARPPTCQRTHTQTHTRPPPSRSRAEGYKILPEPSGYVPIRTPARKLMATPTPFGATPLYGIPEEDR